MRVERGQEMPDLLAFAIKLVRRPQEGIAEYAEALESFRSDDLGDPISLPRTAIRRARSALRPGARGLVMVSVTR